MSRTVETRDGGRKNFDTTFPDGTLEVHVDGVAQVAVGMPNSKVTFFKVIGGKQDAEHGPIEQREVNVTITLATSVLIEGFTNVLQGIVANRANLADAADQYRESVHKALESIAVDPLPPRAPAKKKITLRRSKH